MDETLAQLMKTFNVAEAIDPTSIDTVQTERLQVERLVIGLKDGSERMFYRHAQEPQVSPIVVSGEQIRRKSCWHQKRAKPTT
jgi:hypothetical protein